MSAPSSFDEFLSGLWKQNPIFVMVLGMCPTLAVTVSAVNAISMGLATTFVLGAGLRGSPVRAYSWRAGPASRPDLCRGNRPC